MSNEIAITGAGGRMASVLRESFRQDGRSLALLARSQTEHFDDERLLLGNLEDYEYVAASLAGVESVIHLGGKADESDFSEIVSSNILGTYNVFEAARENGVRRVIYASSHHVSGFRSANEMTSVEDPVRPDTLYGVSKVFGEGLGRLYADKWGLEVVCLRIGVCRPEPENTDQLRTWLSEGDAVRLIEAALNSRLDNRYAVVYGVSNNEHRFWDDSPARGLGYVPQDSADAFFSEIKEVPEFSSPFQGGRFTGVDYAGGTW